MLTGNDNNLINNIPLDTNVIISHTPPLGILSNSGNVDYGSPELLEKVNQVKPHYHLFGHIHNSYGLIKSGKTTYVNSALVDSNYSPINLPHLLEILFASNHSIY